MTRARIAVGAGTVSFAILFAACSLNPQPLPPDTNDSGSFDATTSNGDATALNDDGGAGGETGPVPQGDAASDAESGDASDAADAEDAPSDAYAGDAND